MYNVHIYLASKTNCNYLLVEQETSFKLPTTTNDSQCYVGRTRSMECIGHLQGCHYHDNHLQRLLMESVQRKRWYLSRTATSLYWQHFAMSFVILSINLYENEIIIVFCSNNNISPTVGYGEITAKMKMFNNFKTVEDLDESCRKSITDWPRSFRTRVSDEDICK